MTAEFKVSGTPEGGWKGGGADQLTLFQQRGQIMPNKLLNTCPTRFIDSATPLLIPIDFKSLVYSGTVDNLYLLVRL